MSHIKPLALGAVFAALAGSMPGAAGADLPPPPPHNWYQQPGYLPGRVRVDSPVAPKDVPSFQQHRIPCVVNGVPVVADIGSGVIGDNSTLYGVTFKSDGTGCTLSTLVRVTGTHSTAEPLVEAVAKASPVVGEVLKAAGGIGPNPRSVEEIMVRSGVFAGPDHTIYIDQPYVFYLLLAKRQAGLQPQDPLLVVNPQSARNASAVPLTGDWWTRTDLLPQTLASPLRVTGVGRAGTFKLSTGAEIPGGSIVMAETTRAYFLDTKGALRPLVTLPDTAPGITLSGGRFPVPVGGGLEVTPASTALPYPAAAESATVVFRGLVALAASAGTVLSGPVGWAVVAGTVFISGAAAYTIWDAKQQTGLTDKELGTLFNKAPIDLPTIPEVEAAIERSDPRLATPLAQSLKAPGTCGQDEYNKLDKEKRAACPRSVPLRCEDTMSRAELVIRAGVFLMCARKREELEDKCFDGGDSGHRKQRESVLSGLKNCLDLM